MLCWKKEKKKLELIILCLQEDECKLILEERKIQRTMVNNYFLQGEKLHYGAEMLSNIKKTSLDLSIAFDLLLNINTALKNKSIVNRYSPLLTCLLLWEILSVIIL